MASTATHQGQISKYIALVAMFYLPVTAVSVRNPLLDLAECLEPGDYYINGFLVPITC